VYSSNFIDTVEEIEDSCEVITTDLIVNFMLKRGITLKTDYKGPGLMPKPFTGNNSTPFRDEFNYSDYRNTAIILDAIA